MAQRGEMVVFQADLIGKRLGTSASDGNDLSVASKSSLADPIKNNFKAAHGRNKSAHEAAELDPWQRDREREREEDRKRLVKRSLPFDESAPLVRKLQQETDQTKGTA
jgi:hypothetical protein